VDRLLGGTGGATLGGTATLDATSRGVLGYLAARLLADRDAAWGLRLVTVDARRAIASLMPGPLVSGAWTVRVGNDVGRVRAWLTPPSFATGALTRNTHPSALLATEVALCADAGHAWLTPRDLETLGRGDTVMIERTGLARDDDGWSGRVALQVNGARRTQWSAALHGENLTIEARQSSKELAMSEGTNEERGHDPVELAGDAPIEVSVEIARFTLPLEELAALRTGEVLRTGRPIGQEVALRAGGRVIARAELVEIDGEVGARIL
jgi:type III secretion system YscQ/HrcQ family protein